MYIFDREYIKRANKLSLLNVFNLQFYIYLNENLLENGIAKV